MDERRFQFYGLIGFVLSGLVFLAASIANRDWWTFTGAVVWLVACGFWMFPFLRPDR